MTAGVGGGVCGFVCCSDESSGIFLPPLSFSGSVLRKLCRLVLLRHRHHLNLDFVFENVDFVLDLNCDFENVDCGDYVILK